MERSDRHCLMPPLVVSNVIVCLGAKKLALDGGPEHNGSLNPMPVGEGIILKSGGDPSSGCRMKAFR